MFTIEQIKEAHSKVKSGADFPSYVQDLVQLGVLCYHSYVSDGHTLYEGAGNDTVQSPAKYSMMPVAGKSNAEQLRQFLQIHQRGETDYLTFCSHAARTGVEKWTVDTRAMTCSYYDKAGNMLLAEAIPSV